MTVQYLSQSSFAHPAENIDSRLVVHTRNNDTVVLLIHGLGGSRYGNKPTWGNFPKFMFDDFSKIDVAIYSYATLFRRGAFWKSLSLEKEAEVLLDILDRLPYRRIVIFGHSMGGLLSRLAITNARHKRKDELLRKIVGLFLFAVPTLGSKWVPAWLRHFSSDAAALRTFSTVATRTAEEFSNIEVSLNKRLHSPRRIPTWSVVAAEDTVVSRISALASVPDKQRRSFALSHTRIVKPDSRSDECYLYVSDALANILAMSESASVVQRTKNKYQFSAAKSDEAQEITQFASAVLGQPVSNHSLLAGWLSVDPTSVWVARKRDKQHHPGPIVGYWCAFGIPESVADDLRSGKLTGNLITSEHLAKNERDISAFYVGGLAGSGKTACALTEATLLDHLRRKNSASNLPILSRPVSEDGLRLAMGFMMRPISGDFSKGNIFEGSLNRRYGAAVTKP